MGYIRDITDEQILKILDLTTHPPEKTEAIWSRNSNQREGMDTFVGTDEELVSKIRHILEDTPEVEPNSDQNYEKDLMLAYVKKVLLDPEFLSAFSEAFFDMPIPQPKTEVKSLQQAFDQATSVYEEDIK